MTFAAKRTCDECPWRTDVPVGRFPPERYEALQNTCRQGFGKAIFACHKTQEGKEIACAGFILVEGHNNWAVRLAVMHKAFSPDEIQATGPLYSSFKEMAAANGFDT